MTKDEALKLVLEFIERVNKDGWILADFEPQMYEAITAIKEALAKPEQEPVKLVSYNCKCGRTMNFESVHGVVAPQRKPLTDEEILTVARDHYNPHQRPEISFARAIEAAHNIKE